MFSGAHVVIFSKDADADRAFFRDVLGMSNIDVGGGWLIFKLPPTEVAFHPTDGDGKHELYFLVEDVEAFVAAVGEHDVTCEPIKDEGWGLMTSLPLPGGGTLGVYQPKHGQPE